MAHDFYRKAQDLHEEFQKRELQYLSAEKRWNSMVLKKDLNLPLQDYLQKINKREKETEETYRNLMKQMEELDKHTDILSLKLEKLGALRNSVSHIGYPFWPSGLSTSNLDIYGYGVTSNLNAKPDFSAQGQNSKSVSTQTDNAIYCEKCKSQLFITNNSYQSLGSENLPFSSLQSSVSHRGQTMLNQQSFETQNIHASLFSQQSVSNNKQQIMFDKPQESFETNTLQSEVNHRQIFNSSEDNINSTVLNATQSISQPVENPVVSETVASTNIDKSFIVNSKSNEPTFNLSYEQNLHSTPLPQQPESLPEPHLSYSLIQSTKQKPLRLENDLYDMLQNKDELPDTQPHFILNENIEKSETKDVDDQSIDASVSKSDGESMNHEFDFLESETANVSKKAATQNKTKVVPTSLNDDDTNLEKASKSVSGQSEQSDLKPKEESSDIKNKSSVVINSNGNKSDSSGAPSPSPSIRSPNISASDSDSFYGKETPLTATAAYQALLGNTIIPEKKKSQKYSDSESDEVENALANAVRRGSHVPSKPAPVKKDEKPAPNQVESKSTNKASKVPAASKSKSKLSKSTRKVLGLDTSSGSEVELAVKPPIKKIEEDSDEFDFYD